TTAARLPQCALKMGNLRQAKNAANGAASQTPGSNPMTGNLLKITARVTTKAASARLGDDDATLPNI
ncbi:MAG: hypothetical protein VXX08_07065, partial [Pseudomonadota bacterium]|nr:hypothetical protein [Pseudomonadota bacterium]